MRRFQRPGACLALAATISLGAMPAGAADIVTRTPNINSVEGPAPGSVDFYFNHRMTGFVPGFAAVSSAPTIQLDIGVLPWLGVYTAYASKATATGPVGQSVSGAHDLSIGLKQFILNQEAGAPVSLMLHEAMGTVGLKGGDTAATQDVWYTGGLTSASPQQGLGATLGRTFGPLGLVGTVRALGYQYAVIGSTIQSTPGIRTSGALGASLAISPHLTLAGDYGKYFDALGEVPAWSAALQGQIPATPHMVAIEMTNVPTTTVSGISQAAAGNLYVGFSFTALFQGLGRWQKMITPTWLKAAPKPEEEPAEGSAAPAPEIAAVPAASAAVAVAAPATDSAAAPTPAPPKPAADPKLIARGKKVFAEAADMGCGSCHGDDARGGDGAPSLVGKTVADMKAAFKGSSMETFAELKDGDLKALEAYFKSLE